MNLVKKMLLVVREAIYMVALTTVTLFLITNMLFNYGRHISFLPVRGAWGLTDFGRHMVYIAVFGIVAIITYLVRIKKLKKSETLFKKKILVAVIKVMILVLLALTLLGIRHTSKTCEDCIDFSPPKVRTL